MKLLWLLLSLTSPISIYGEGATLVGKRAQGMEFWEKTQLVYEYRSQLTLLDQSVIPETLQEIRIFMNNKGQVEQLKRDLHNINAN